MNHSMPGLHIHHQLLDSTQTHVHWVCDAIQPSHPLSSLLLLPSIFPSIRVFSNESALCNRWPKYWSFSFNINPSNEHPGLISFRMNWLDLFAVQGTLKHLLQNHSSKASIWNGNRQEEEGFSYRGNRLQVSDIFSLFLKWQKETNNVRFFSPFSIQI